jgi:prepilin-type N-terminal cleavage/methylation domain-containing protein
MIKRGAFTLIELLVVIAIIAVLMSILMPALNKAKLQAQDAVDKSNQHQFALIWKFWTDENEGFFPDRGGGDCWGAVNMGAWPYVLYDYMPSIDRSIYLCPAAIKPRLEGARCPYGAWDCSDGTGGFTVYGSYTCNYWVANRKPGDEEYEYYWKTPAVKGASYVPLLMCGNWKDSEPQPTDEPWDTRERMAAECWEPHRNEMKRVLHDRHGTFVNTNMLDLSARAVGLKELWILKWHKVWPTDCLHLPNPWPAWLEELPEPCPPPVVP